MASPTNSIYPNNRNFVTFDFIGPKSNTATKTSIIVYDDPVVADATAYIEFDSDNQQLKVDVIAEHTAAAGVTIDGVLLKDNDVTADEVSTDTISEKTAAAGVTVDGVLIKDNDVTADEVSTDTISEKTAANGVVIDGVTLKDGGVVGLAIGTDVQAHDAHLDEISALSANGQFLFRNSGTIQLADPADWITQLTLIDRVRNDGTSLILGWSGADRITFSGNDMLPSAANNLNLGSQALPLNAVSCSNYNFVATLAGSAGASLGYIPVLVNGVTSGKIQVYAT